MDKKIDIHKAGAILIKDRKFLVTHEQGKQFYIAPGGVVEKNETPSETIVRELQEEINIIVQTPDLEFFGTFFAAAAGAEDKFLQKEIKIGSIFEHEVLPRLKQKNLID